jgi:hypothetical protein
MTNHQPSLMVGRSPALFQDKSSQNSLRALPSEIELHPRGFHIQESPPCISFLGNLKSSLELQVYKR